MAPIPISRAEFAAKFGGESATPAPIPISRSEYAARFETPAAPTQTGAGAFSGGIGNIANALTFGFGDEILGGIAAPLAYAGNKIAGDGQMTLGQAYEGARDNIRSDIEGFRNENPIASALGSVAGGLKVPAGYLVGKAASLPGKLGALLTEGAAYGGAYGMGEAEGGIEQRLAAGLEGAQTGAIVSGAIGTPLLAGQAALTKLAPKLEEAGKGFLRKSLGTREGDYAKTAKDLDIWDVADDEVETLTKRALDSLEDAGAFGKDRNPKRLVADILKQERALTTKIDSTIRAVDDTGARALPKFDNALQYLSEGKVPANKIDSYLNELDSLGEAIKSEGKGKLTYLQQQKIVAGAKYVPDDGPANGFWRAVYKDIQKTIEEAAPEVGPLNQELQKIKIAKPIVQRGLSKEEAATWTGWAQQAIRTSGGTLTTPILIGATIGGQAGGPLGAIGGAALSAAVSPRGQQVVGGKLKNAISGASALGSAVERVPATVSALSRESDSERKTLEQDRISSRTKSQASLKPTTFSNVVNNAIDRAMTKIETPKVLSARRVMDEVPKIDNLVQAVIQQESAGKVKAVSSKGAQGLMQLMPETGKEMHKKLGIKEPYDPFDPEQNVILGTAYLKEQLATFKDERLALAAYNMGPGALKKIMHKLSTRDWDKIAAYLKGKGMYAETVAYVPSILKKMGGTVKA